MVTLGVDVKQCSCGYAFEQNDTGSSPSSEEIRLNAEQLYETYLSARAEQAALAVKTTQAEFARHPENFEISERVAQTIRDAQGAQANLRAQIARVAALKKIMQAKTQPISTSVRVTVQPTGTRITRTVTPSRPAPMTRNTKPMGSSRRADTRPAITTGITRRTVRKKPVSTPLQPTVSMPPVQTPAPKVFRAAQAAKAEKIMHAAHAKKQGSIALPTPPIAKTETLPGTEKPAKVKVAITAKPVKAPEAPRPANVSKAPPTRMVALSRECPNCTAAVPGSEARCRCGYEFPCSEQLIPSLSMTDEERNLFMQGLSLP